MVGEKLQEANRILGRITKLQTRAKAITELMASLRESGIEDRVKFRLERNTSGLTQISLTEEGTKIVLTLVANRTEKELIALRLQLKALEEE